MHFAAMQASMASAASNNPLLNPMGATPRPPPGSVLSPQFHPMSREAAAAAVMHPLSATARAHTVDPLYLSATQNLQAFAHEQSMADQLQHRAAIQDEYMRQLMAAGQAVSRP